MALIESFDQTERSAREAARGEIGDVRLGYVLAAATAGYIQRIIEVSRAKLPNVTVHIHRMETLSQMKGIAAGSLDIGIMRGMDSYPTGVEAFSLPSQRFSLAMHRNHPLAKQKVITTSMLANQKFVAYELDAEVGFYRNITAVLPPGTIPQIVQRVPDAISVLTLVSADVGIAIVPESFQKLVDTSVVVKSISGPAKYSSNVMVFRKNEPSPAVQAVTNAIRATFPASS
ncbi:MAG TPA: LysR family substrate-binding domain-containing protein [Pseudolabrys sp.]